MKTGLVLEGGAMRGMFTAGVLDVLMENGITVDGAIGVDCLAGGSGPRRMRALERDLGAVQRSKRNNTLLVAYRTKGLTGS